MHGNTAFTKTYANKVSKAQWVKEHEHLKDHVGGQDLGDIHDELTKKPDEPKEEKAEKPKK